MPILHTVNKTPFQGGCLESCLRHALDASAVLLIEDGVYAAMRGTQFEPTLAEALGRLHVYALDADLRARGIARTRLVPGVQVVDYPGFVALAVRCDKVQAWL